MILKEAFIPDFLEQEGRVNKQIYRAVTRSMNTSLPPMERGRTWGEALKEVVKKKAISYEVVHAQRSAEYGEEIVDVSLADKRILEGFSPQLKKAVEKGEANPQAAFAIVEYYLKPGFRNLLPDQVVSLARAFPPKDPKISFGQYKFNLEQKNQNLVIPGRSAQESWEIKREIMDLLEIADHITKRLLSLPPKRTIFTSDLMRITAGALQIVHMASTRLGIKRLEKQDQELLENKQVPLTRNPRKDWLPRVLKKPSIALLAFFFPSARWFEADMTKLVPSLPDIPVEGLENIPTSSPVIIAFSHIDRWRDSKIPFFWEKIKMIEQVQKRRADRTIHVVAYTKYFEETAPRVFKGIAKRTINHVLLGLRNAYGINIINVDPWKIESNKQFLEQAQAVLRNGQPLLVSPEALPTSETLKPKRGLGMLARITGVPVVGVAFREEQLPNGSFQHRVFFTKVHIFDPTHLPGSSQKEKDQAFADEVARSIASFLPSEQRGPFR